MDDQELSIRLRMAVMHLSRRLRRESNTTLSWAQFSLLAQVVRRESATINELAILEQVQPPAVSRAVARLEASGMIRRTVNPDDRRVVNVTGTPSGAAIVDASRRRMASVLSGWIQDLDVEERELLRHATPALERLSQAGAFEVTGSD